MLGTGKVSSVSSGRAGSLLRGASIRDENNAAMVGYPKLCCYGWLRIYIMKNHLSLSLHLVLLVLFLAIQYHL